MANPAKSDPAAATPATPIVAPACATVFGLTYFKAESAPL